MVSVWTSLPLHLSCTCHALAARKYWCVMSDLNPNISSAASLWLEQTPSFHGLCFCFSSGFLGIFLFIFLKSSWFYSSCIISLFLLGLIHHIELTVFWSYTPPSSECMTCVTSTLLMICNDNSSKGSCTKWLMHFIIFTVSAGFQLTLWFVVRWVITCVLLHFCTCGWPFSRWLETFISAICSGHGCMTKEETFLEPLKGLWVRIKQPV